MKKLAHFEEHIGLSLSTWVEIMSAFTKIRALELELIEANGLTIGQFGVLELLYHRGSQSIGAATKLAMSTPRKYDCCRQKPRKTRADNIREVRRGQTECHDIDNRGRKHSDRVDISWAFKKDRPIFIRSIQRGKRGSSGFA